MLIRVIGILLLCGLAGCAGGPPGPGYGYDRGQSSVVTHVVQRGDTLYSIAFRYGLDYREVAQVNSIVAPYTIYPGQNIYLWQVSPAPAADTPAPAAPVAVASAPSPRPLPVTPSSSTPSPVIVTAVPGIAAPPPREVPMSPGPVYQNVPAGNRGDSGNVAVAAPAVPTDPIPPPLAPAPAPAGELATTRPPVPPPATAPAPQPAASPAIAAPTVAARIPRPGGKVTAWRWPASGPVTRRYSPSVHKGIDIGGNRGDPIYAVADGTVVYAGTGIVGFGELVIIKHNEVYISAYGHNDRLLVKENDIVGVGQPIAEKGSSGTDTVKLHFEIRKEGKPIDPLKLLPRS